METSIPGDWQLKCSKTRERLSHLLKTKLWSDCKFLVGGDEGQETFSAHKFVLAMSSPVFEAMFYGGMPEGSFPIAISDVQPEAFKSLINFLYTDDGKIRSFQEAGELYYAAKKYMVPYIQKRCVYHMVCTLTPQNACYAYEFATLFEETGLLDAAFKKITRKTNEVLKETSYEDIQLSTLMMIVKQEHLTIDSELELFQSLEKYTQAHGVKELKRSSEPCDDAKRMKMDESQITSLQDDNNEISEKTDVEETMKTASESDEMISRVRAAIPHIRFLSLSIRELGVAAQSVLLTVSEALALLLRLAGVSVAIPDQISTRTERRDVTLVGAVPEPTAGPTYEGIMVFSIYNFKTRKRPVRSEHFFTDSIKWYVRAVPGTERGSDGVEQKALGVFVNCEVEGGKPWSCLAQVSLELVTKYSASLKRTFTHTYNSSACSHGFTRLAWWDAVVDSYLSANILTIQARVTASNITLN